MMADYIDRQMSIFDWLGESQWTSFRPGDTTEDIKYVGKIIPWSELISLWIGHPVWYRIIMQSMTYYKLVIPENVLIKQIPYYINGSKVMKDRVVCYDGERQRALIDECGIGTDYQYPQSGAFYEVKHDNHTSKI